MSFRYYRSFLIARIGYMVFHPDSVGDGRCCNLNTVEQVKFACANISRIRELVSHSRT